MTSAALDRILALLVVAMVTTGLATLRVGHPSGAWLFVLHGVLAGLLAAAVVLKLRRSLPRAIAGRHIGRLALAGVVSLAVIAALSGGWLWVASGEIVWLDAGVFGRWTLLTLHAWVGLALLPLVAVHLLPRRWRLLRPSGRALRATRSRLLSRRAVLAGGAFAVVGLGLVGVAAVVERVRGGERRFTGSRWLPAGGVPPSTTFFGEPAPAIDPAAWRLRVDGLVTRPGLLTLAELRTVGDVETSAVLDCTSGWALETGWRGVPLRAVLEASGVAAGAREVVIRSVTGWSTSLPIAETDVALLAWEVAGLPLPTANGAPLRLVLPDRRGVDWVKWVGAVTVS